MCIYIQNTCLQIPALKRNTSNLREETVKAGDRINNEVNKQRPSRRSDRRPSVVMEEAQGNLTI